MTRRAQGIALLALVVSLAGCGRLDELDYQPLTTPDEWCRMRPCVDFGGTVLNEPTSSLLVFFLAALWVGIGASFLVARYGQRSRAWLGLSLILGGIAAGLAGVSYQAFSYLLKCEGREYCSLTNGFEVGYSVTQAASVSAMVLAVAYSCAHGTARRWLVGYALANVVAYAAVTVAGVLLPSAFLLSFEVLLLFALPGVILTGVVAARHYLVNSDVMSWRILWAVLLLVLVQVAYFAYLVFGITEALWDDGRGPYFSANDVLHVGMAAWLLYVYFALRNTLADEGSDLFAVDVEDEDALDAGR
ncbi:MAG: hypothetical protein ACKOT0_05040 [bacterium]